MSKVAIVTGSNKGIGYGIVRTLLFGSDKFKPFDGIIYLTSRDQGRGLAAIEQLRAEPVAAACGKAISLVDERIRLHQLDITCGDSVAKFASHIQSNHPAGVDVLINNAGIAFKQASTATMAEQAKVTMETNYFGTKRIIEALLPLMKRDGSRIVNVSSYCGLLFLLDDSSPIKTQLIDTTLTVGQLDKIVDDFITSASDGSYKAKGFSGSSYVMSKIAVSALTCVYQRRLDEQDPNGKVVLCHLHPGYVDTDMTSHKGVWTIEQGAQSAVFAALESATSLDQIRGQMIWKDCRFVDWKTFNEPA